MSFDPVLGPFGLFLLYGAPGLGIAFALFPEKFSRRAGWEELVEMSVLAVLLSVTVTILIGSGLAASPGGFGATWSSPGLLLGDAVIAVLGVLVGVGRRLTGGIPPVPDPISTADDGWSTTRTLEQMAAEERQLRRSLRHAGLGAPERAAAEARLGELKAERESLRKSREARFAT